MKAILSIVAVGLIFTAVSSAASGRNNVLLIHSFSRMDSWTAAIHRGIVDTILSERPSTNMCIEYMDARHYVKDGFLFDMAMTYEMKYSSQHIDLIVCTGGYACNLIEYYGSYIFPHIPVVICGIGNKMFAGIGRMEEKTGVIKDYTAMDTALLAMDLQSETRNIALLYDGTEDVMDDRADFADRIGELPDGVDIIDLPAMKEEILKEKLVSLPNNTVVIDLGYQRSSDGNFYSTREIMDILNEFCPMPVYSTRASVIEKYGAIGGFVNFASKHGGLAAEKALAILEGVPAGDIPVAYEGFSGYMLNYAEMTGRGIPGAFIPSGSLVVNNPDTFFEKYAHIIIPYLVLISALMLLAAYLGENIRRRKKAQRKLLREKIFMKQLFENSPDGIVLLDDNGNILRANLEMGRLFKVRPQNIVGLNIDRIFVPGSSPGKGGKSLSAVISGGHGFRTETVQCRTDGTEIPLVLSGMPFQVEEQTMIYGIYRDISERQRSKRRLHKRLAFEKFISKTSSSMVFGDDLDKLIDSSLGDLCIMTNAARGCIVFLEEGRSQDRELRRWVFHDGRTLPTEGGLRVQENAYWFIEYLRKFGQLIAEDVRSSSVPEKQLAAFTGGLSPKGLIVLPFYNSNLICGYLFLCDPWPEQVWTSQDVTLLRTYCHIVGEAFLRNISEEQLRKNFKSLERTFEGTIDSVGKILEVKDPFTAGHQRRVTKLSVAIATEMGLAKERITGLYYAALVHDIGKINIPSEILNKPGKLSSLEEALVREHCRYGWEILEKVDFPWAVADIVLQHHEHMDGSGYPNGLKGEEIMQEARILTVADILESMSFDRPYRPFQGMDKAFGNIKRFSGTYYDPEVVKICLSLFEEQKFSFADEDNAN